MEKSLEEKYGKEAADHIQMVVDATYNNYEEYDCADNFRIARASDPEEVKAYQDAYDEGCCGFYDTVIMVQHESNNFLSEAFLFGFNYGH